MKLENLAMTAKIEGERKRKRPRTRTYFIRRVYFTKIVYFVKKEGGFISTENHFGYSYGSRFGGKCYFWSILSIVFYCNEIVL